MEPRFYHNSTDYLSTHNTLIHSFGLAQPKFICHMSPTHSHNIFTFIPIRFKEFDVSFATWFCRDDHHFSDVYRLSQLSSTKMNCRTPFRFIIFTCRMRCLSFTQRQSPILCLFRLSLSFSGSFVVLRQ